MECLYIGAVQISASVAIFMKKDKKLLVIMVSVIFFLNCFLCGSILTRFAIERDRLEGTFLETKSSFQKNLFFMKI